MNKEIIIDGVKYFLTPDLESLSDDEFVNYILEKQNIDFRVGDIVWYKGESIRKGCGQTQFEVLEIKPHLIQGKRVDCYLNVKLIDSYDRTVHFFTEHLEKYKTVVYE